MKILLTIFLFTVGFFANAQNDVCPLKVGEKVPSLMLLNIEGEEVDLNVVTQKPTVLIFFRGGWCGYCSKHLSAIQEAKNDIEKLGYQIIAITPDQVSKLSETVDKTKLDYLLLSDASATAIDAFGLSYTVEGEMAAKFKKNKLDLAAWSGQEHNKLPVPAIYIIKEAQVLFNYVNPNYTKRLEAETLIALLKTL